MTNKNDTLRAAAEFLAKEYEYDTTLGPLELDRWLLQRVDEHRAVWTLVWKAARRHERKTQDEWFNEQVAELQEKLRVTRTNLDGVVQTAATRLQRIRTLEAAQSSSTFLNLHAQIANKTARNEELARTNSNLLGENVRLKKELTEAKLGGRLYDQVEKELHNAEDELGLSRTREAHLSRLNVEQSRQLRDKQQVIDSLRASLTGSTEKRNELLARAQSAEAKLVKLQATPTPKIPAKPQGEGWQLSWVKLTGDTITGTVTRVRCDHRPAQDAPQHLHSCNEVENHESLHMCTCGKVWVNMRLR